jgi:F-type H+-transporting ATPase subunit a
MINSFNMNINLFINSPLEQFEVVNLLGLNAPILGHLNLAFTNIALYSLLVLLIVIGLHYFGNNNTKLVPSKWSIALESSFQSINSIVREQIGYIHELYLPFIYALFYFIVIANLNGNVPYSYTITTSIITSLSLSFTILIAVTILAFYLHKLAFFSYFVPLGTPLPLVPLLVLIELVSYLARGFSLGIRLFANVVAGHTLLKILSTFLYQMFTASLTLFIITLLPFTFFLALSGLEIAVSIIQAYVFILLTSSYLKDSINLH